VSGHRTTKAGRPVNTIRFVQEKLSVTDFWLF